MVLVIKKSEDEDRRLVYGEVYAPNRPDADREFMLAEDIEAMAHDFMRRMKQDRVDTHHNNEVIPNVVVVESFIARKGDPDFIEGAWVVGVHINDDDTWEKVKKGELSGFSLEALVNYEDVEVEIEMPPIVSGVTSKSEEHTHKFFVTYDKEGNFKGGVTDEVNGHKHAIICGTRTEKAEGHSHMFSAVDDIEIVG